MRKTVLVLETRVQSHLLPAPEWLKPTGVAGQVHGEWPEVFRLAEVVERNVAGGHCLMDVGPDCTVRVWDATPVPK